MKKNISRLLVIILLTFCIFSIIPSNIYATSIGEIFEGGDSFISAGQGDSEMLPIQDMSNLIYNILLIIGVVIAIIVGIIIGIKFMTGSVEEKAKVKEAFVAYIAGCVVVFGAFTIWKVVVEIIQSTPVS